MNIFDFADEVNSHCVEFTLYTNSWEKFHWPKAVPHKKRVWREVQYLKNGKLNNQINQITNKKGGIYLFIIKCPILPNSSEYLAYIGRAQFSNNHNLRIRVKKYFTEYSQENRRPKVARMIHKWGNYLFLKYIELDDNKTITTLEARLINGLLPPFNDEIPEKKLRKAKKAFK